MLAYLKQQLAGHMPDLAAAFQGYQQSVAANRHPMKRTPFGFWLKGHAEMMDGSFEQQEVALLAERLKHAGVFVDIGANIGYFVCLALQMSRHVIAVEPLAENLNQLYANLQANDWSSVEVFPVGLASRPGIAPLYGGGTGASLIPRWAGTATYWQRTIPLSTLDTLLESRFLQQQLVIKIDVEGTEFDVLQGAQQTLRRSPRPVWMVEVCLTEHHPDGFNPMFQQVFDLFWKAGYQAYSVERNSRMIHPGDVRRWLRHRKRDFGSSNVLFEVRGESA